MIRYRAYYMGLFVMVAVVLVLGLAETVIYTPAGPLVPALQSYWLAIHVTAMTLATGVFFVAAVTGIMYLFVDRHARRVAAGLPAGADGILRRLPGPEALDRLAYRTVVFGFPIWTFGVMAGAIWADQAWGSYWGWDPTETWAFITWVVYACFLHARATAGWRGRRAAYHPAGRVRLPAVQRARGEPGHPRPALLRRPELTGRRSSFDPQSPDSRASLIRRLSSARNSGSSSGPIGRSRPRPPGSRPGRARSRCRDPWPGRPGAA